MLGALCAFSIWCSCALKSQNLPYSRHHASLMGFPSLKTIILHPMRNELHQTQNELHRMQNLLLW